ncbi:MAG TPA: tRNA (guanosine(37)-N1)-methyltransferase TrmD [Dehalococcoidia bacterium]|nr:tRNA (guanosine(37)-N1)-methyltransferase TrmD [Dehalococcoidia bacterium]
MKFHVLTLFPEAFTGPMQHSILGHAQERGLISVQLTDIRDHTHDAHNTADDYQFGGGFGMVMKPEPIFEAVEDVLSVHSEDERRAIPIILMSPQGQTLDQQLVEDLSRGRELVIICGHYAGVDQRVREHLITREISIGDYVLTGGELAAMVLIDAVSRFIDGVVGSRENVLEDSFASGLLQHPLYTRPADFRKFSVPEILRSGHHGEIDRWRRHQSLRTTLENRPDLLSRAALTSDDLAFLQSLGWPPAESRE